MDRQWSDRARSNPTTAPAVVEGAKQDERLPWTASNTPELMVTFRLTNGDWKVYPYHELAGFDFMGNERIALYFYNATVMIEGAAGASLEKLADLLRRQQVMEVREQNEFAAPLGVPCVRKISILPANLEAGARKPAA